MIIDYKIVQEFPPNLGLTALNGILKKNPRNLKHHALTITFNGFYRSDCYQYIDIYLHSSPYLANVEYIKCSIENMLNKNSEAPDNPEYNITT